MPTIKDIDSSYRLFFYSHESNEPVHVHVSKEGSTCKIWMKSLELASNDGFKKYELKEIMETASKHKMTILNARKKHFQRK